MFLSFRSFTVPGTFSKSSCRLVITVLVGLLLLLFFVAAAGGGINPSVVGCKNHAVDSCCSCQTEAEDEIDESKSNMVLG